MKPKTINKKMARTKTTTCENTENVDSEEEKDEDLKLERGSKVQIAPPDQLADLGYSTLHELGIACAARLT